MKQKPHSFGWIIKIGNTKIMDNTIMLYYIFYIDFSDQLMDNTIMLYYIFYIDFSDQLIDCILPHLFKYYYLQILSSNFFFHFTIKIFNFHTF